MKTKFYLNLQLVFWLFLLLLSFSLPAQNDFTKVDSIATSLELKASSVSELAEALTATLDTDLDKARAFYMWIAKNIRYDCRKYHKPRKVKIPVAPGASAKDKENVLKEWRSEQVLKTLKYKKGVCEDYSQLFKALCDEAGVEALVIRGNARDFHRPYRRKHKNPHAWNAIKIAGQWHLLDATWGAGYTDAAVKKFTRRLSPGYFCTPPAYFIQNHFPDDEKWQLLEQPMSQKVFSGQPLINYAHSDYQIKDFSKEVLKMESGPHRKQVWLEFEKVPKILTIATQKGKKVNFDRVDEGNKILLNFPKTSIRSIVIYGGESRRRRMGWLAKYELSTR